MFLVRNVLSVICVMHIVNKVINIFIDTVVICITS